MPEPKSTKSQALARRPGQNKLRPTLALLILPIVIVATREAIRAIPQMIREGADPVGGTPEQFGQFARKEFVKWQKIVKDSGATVD